MIKLIQGDCLDVMKGMEDNSISSIVTDPPYGISFMSKKWDYDVPSVEIWEECLRVLKPGGTALIFAGSRTQHRMAVNVEDAGFILKDTIMWIYGSGFPKSLDISKAIDKSHGVEFEKVPASGVGFMNNNNDGYNTTLNQLIKIGESTPEAKQWNGQGTALKPAYEPIIVAMKPNDGTYANNALKHGVAGINIDGSRVPANDFDPKDRVGASKLMEDRPWQSKQKENGRPRITEGHEKGRFPANIIHDGSDEVLRLFPKDAGASGPVLGTEESNPAKNTYGEYGRVKGKFNNDKGSAARFFYTAKASKSERNIGVSIFDSIEHVCNRETIKLNKTETPWEKLGLNQNIKAEKDTQQRRGIIVSVFGILPQKVADLCLLMCLNGRRPTGQFLKALMFITSTATNKTTALEIYNLLHYWNINESTAGANCGMVSGGSPVKYVKNSIQSQKITGTSQKKDGHFMEDAESAISKSLFAKNVIEEIEKECSKIPSHPTVKPLALIEYLCKLVKQPSPNAITLDPFMGSNTTGLACNNLGIDFIGIERDPEYFKIAEQRISGYVPDEIEYEDPDQIQMTF